MSAVKEQEFRVVANEIAKAAFAELDAERAVTRSIREALEGLVRAVDDLDAENGDRNLFVSPGCVICTDGVTPYKYDTGLCAYHTAKAALAKARGEVKP